MLNRTFWKGRKVLITGHTGFKGSWLCLWLESIGAKVTGYTAGTSPVMTSDSRLARNRAAMATSVAVVMRVRCMAR